MHNAFYLIRADIMQHNVGLSSSPSSSCTLTNGNSAADVDEDDARSNNAGDSPNNEPQQEEENPIEYQTYECDEVTKSQMDPLEYTFRKYIPIPRVYFWDAAVTSSGNVHHDTNNLPRRIKLWHYTIYYLGEGLRIAEKGGEVVANILGLNDGPFDYVTSGMTPEDMLASRVMMDEKRLRRAELEETTRNDERGV